MKKDNARLHETIVGIFVLLVFFGLALFTIVLSGAKLFGGKASTELKVQFDSVGGLGRHDTVLVRGVPVGQVKNLELGEDGVLVTLSINEKLALHDDYLIRAESSSLLGGMQLVIVEGVGAPMDVEGKVLRGEPPANVMENVNGLVSDIRHSLNEGGILTNLETVIADVRHSLDEGGVLTNLESIVADIADISDRLNNGEGTLGKLLSSDTKLYDDLSSTIADLSAIMDRVNNGEGTVGKLLSSDETIFNDLKTAIADIREIADRLNNGDGTLGKLLSSDSQLYDDLAAGIASLKSVAARIDAGEGLLGQLTRDDGEVGQNVNGLLRDGRDFLDDMRETSPISTFGSIFFGAF